MLPQVNSSVYTDQPRSWITPYYKSFNGIRAVAVSLVFVEHYANYVHLTKLESFAWTGVDLFFVLSGFLITGILYDSLGQHHYFRNFYVRRALRIFPIFYGFFALLFLLTPLLNLRYDVRLLSFFFYVGNLVVPFTDLIHHNPTVIYIVHHGARIPASNIGHLWSLCVEEQFYLLWPGVVWFIRDRRLLMTVCVIGGILALFVRVYICMVFDPNLQHTFLIYWSTYTRFDTLLIGSWFALWLRGVTLSPVRLRQIGAVLFFVPVALLIAVLSARLPSLSLSVVFADRFLDTIGYSLIALAAAGIILLSLDETTHLSRILRWSPLSFLGAISYGFYFFQSLPNYLLQRSTDICFPHLRFAVPFVAFGLTVTMATLSFHFYEAPFLKLKSRLAPGHKSVPSGREELSLPDIL
jgi:peptidoglycan/LPS O-acetylase OafA/YrhL